MTSGTLHKLGAAGTFTRSFVRSSEILANHSTQLESMFTTTSTLIQSGKY